MENNRHDTSTHLGDRFRTKGAGAANRTRAWARAVEKRSKSRIASVIAFAYRLRFFRRIVLNLVKRLEGGEMHSVTLRRILRDFHDVDVGLYSYGPCMLPGLLPPRSSVGKYCSIAEGMRVFRRNHPFSFLSQHPFFYNCELGLLAVDTIEQGKDNPLSIGNDVWIGSGVTILPGCKRIGDGAIVGAGSVVTKDVQSFTIVAGNPARFVRDRYSQDLSELVEQTRWWDIPLSTLLGLAENLLYQPITRGDLGELILRLERMNVAKS